MLFYEERQRRFIAIVSAVAQLVVAWELVDMATHTPTTIGLYLLGDWPPPFAIVLVLDRLAALMVALTALLALPCIVFSTARWDRRGQHFHPLFQFLLMGLNGAFLTGDLFNLFVFFEVLLAASYGLALHGSGTLARPRRAPLHRHQPRRLAPLPHRRQPDLRRHRHPQHGRPRPARARSSPPENRPLLAAGAAVLGIAFLVKAAMWPLCFWLPITYMAAAPPAAAMFAILSKVGVYVILRVSSLAFGAGAAHMAGLGAEVLVAGGLATLVFGTIGVLASQGLGRLAGCAVLVSSGTLLAVVGMASSAGGSAMVAGALYYLVASTLAIAALFLMVELIEREQGALAGILTVTAEAYGLGDDELPFDEDEIREEPPPAPASPAPPPSSASASSPAPSFSPGCRRSPASSASSPCSRPSSAPSRPTAASPTSPSPSPASSSSRASPRSSPSSARASAPSGPPRRRSFPPSRSSSSRPSSSSSPSPSR